MNRWIHLRDLVLELVLRDFKLRYKKSMLGIAWSLLVPLAQFAVMYYVFHNILRMSIPHFTSFLFTGILPWTWFSSSLLAASVAIVDNKALVRQIGFPVEILPAITVILAAVFLGERLTFKTGMGAGLILAGILVLVV